jgi:hypothetical protein
LSIKRNIIIKSIQLTLVLTVVNIIISFILSKAYFGSIETYQITGILGNVTLLESGLLFLYGFIGAYLNTPRLRWDNKDENTSTPVRLKTGHWVIPTKRRMIVVDDNDPSKQGRPFVSILCGAILLAEIVALAILKV